MQTCISKVTSRGQVTLPSDFRQEEGITERDYVIMRKQGKWLIVGKVENLLDEITNGLEKEARKKGITKKQLVKDVESVRKARYLKRLKGHAHSD